MFIYNLKWRNILLESLEIKFFHQVMLQPGTKKNNFTTLLAATVHRETNAGQSCQGIAFTKNSSGTRKCSVYLN